MTNMTNMTKPNKTKKSKKQTAVILDFDSYRSKQLINKLCGKYHMPASFFEPMITELRKHNIISCDKMEKEIDFFMHIREYQGITV